MNWKEDLPVAAGFRGYAKIPLLGRRRLYPEPYGAGFSLRT